MIITILQLVAVGFFGLWYFLLRPRPSNKKYGPPMVTSSPIYPIPLIGQIIEFFSSPHTMMKRCFKDYGPVFTIPIFHKRLTFLIGTEAQEIFFTASDDVLSQEEVYDFMKPVFGPGVVYDANRKKRQVQFQSMANGLRTNRLKAYVSKIEDETYKYFQKEWNQESGEVDLLKALSELTILTASRCLHGDDVRTHMFKEVEQIYHDLDHGLLPITVFWPTAPIKAHRTRDKARQQMIEMFTKVIKERKEYPERNDNTDILSLFMNIKYKDGTAVTEEEVTGLLIALLFAGQHTSCITSTWTSLFIANDPKLVERIRNEQDDVLKTKQSNSSSDTVSGIVETVSTTVKRNGGEAISLDYDDVNNMELLHNCMREALRMCPTFIMILRRAETDISIKVNDRVYEIPKGDFVIVSPTVSMRLPSVFPNPDTYDPDRFAAPREEHKKQPYAYLGFGGGMHSCMGQAFAFIQVKTILSIMFREYDIERISKDMPEVGYDDMVVGPKGNARIRYTKRVRN